MADTGDIKIFVADVYAAAAANPTTRASDTDLATKKQLLMTQGKNLTHIGKR